MSDELLSRVHERIGLGVEIQTSPFSPIDIYWRRDYGDDGWSDQRTLSAATLSEALQAILDYEDDADIQDAVGLRLGDSPDTEEPKT